VESASKDPLVDAAIKKMTMARQWREAWVCPELLIYEDDPMKLPAHVI
jgi:hypothetical protein